MLSLARALAREPDIVLLDEAFSSLDQQLRKSVRRDAEALLREAGAAVLAVTHDPDEAMELADRIVVLSDGKILQEGRPQARFWQPESVTAARLLGEINQVNGQWNSGEFITGFGTIFGNRVEANGSDTAGLSPKFLPFTSRALGRFDALYWA